MKTTNLMKFLTVSATCLWLSGCIFPPDGRYGDHRYDQHGNNNGQGYSDHDRGQYHDQNQGDHDHDHQY